MLDSSAGVASGGRPFDLAEQVHLRVHDHPIAASLNDAFRLLASRMSTEDDPVARAGLIFDFADEVKAGNASHDFGTAPLPIMAVQPAVRKPGETLRKFIESANFITNPTAADRFLACSF